MGIPETIDYKNLTEEQKLGLAYHIRGCYGLIELNHYDELSNNPSEEPYSDNVYISHVLGIDFDEFYNKSDLAELSWKMGDTFTNAIKTNLPHIKDPSKFVGDCIKDIIYHYLSMKNIEEYPVIDEDLLYELDSDLEKAYDLYLKCANHFLDSEKEKDHYFEETDIVVDGEPLYRKVYKKDVGIKK